MLTAETSGKPFPVPAGQVRPGWGQGDLGLMVKTGGPGEEAGAEKDRCLLPPMPVASVLSSLTQPTGYYGPGCVDACLLNPCQNQGSCRHLPGAPHGYTCDCVGGYFGHHCEHR